MLSASIEYQKNSRHLGLLCVTFLEHKNVCIMAPSDDINNHDDEASSVKMMDDQPAASSILPKVVAPEANDNLKNIAFAINYELPMVNQFLAVHHDSRRKSISHSVESRTKSTQQLHVEKDNNNHQHHDQPPALPCTTTTKNGRRISNMENNTPNVFKQYTRDGRMENHLSSSSHATTVDEPPQPLNSDSLSPSTTFKNALSDSPTQHHQNQTKFSLQSPVASITQKRRVSTREKQKREIPLSRSRVKYDMQLVPFVRRNPFFLQQFTPPWWLNKADISRTETIHPSESEGTTNQNSLQPQDQQLHNRRSSRLIPTPEVYVIDKIQEEKEAHKHSCRCNGGADVTTISNQNSSPFEIADITGEADSVIWLPDKRSEWEDTISEMTAVYTAAAFRRHTLDSIEKHQRDKQQNIDDEVTAIVMKPTNEPFAKPLSSDYIRDRIDIDDPLYGYQIRHKYGGWMQGFILYTTFTTWNHGFEFNSQHPFCGISPPNETASNFDNRHVDHDNALAKELEALSRSGDPSVGGIVFSEIAEISILGALGCGEYLLRMALDDIYTNKKQNYKYVILHAADQARAFYEKFGFKRVGAVCKYSNKQNVQLTPESKVPEEPQVLGYRHWTHANEAILHDAPSYMMCLKLPDRCTTEESFADPTDKCCNVCHGIVSRLPPPGEFLRQMLQFQVLSKPRVEPLGTSTVLGLKHLSRRSYSMPLVLNSHSFESQSSCPNIIETSNTWMNHRTGGKATTNTANGAKVLRRKSFTPGRLSKPLSLRESDVPSVNLPMRAASMNSLNGSLTKAPQKSSKSEFKRETSSKGSSSPTNQRPTKRLKAERTIGTAVAQELLPPETKRSSFVEKQYNSVWLAVPPNIPGAVSIHRERAPPKSRTYGAVAVRKRRMKSSTVAAETKPETASIQRTKMESWMLLPVIAEADEFKNATTDEGTAMKEKSRFKRSLHSNLPESSESTSKEVSRVQPPIKISRKRAFTDATTKTEKTKISDSNAGSTEATELTLLPPRISLLDVIPSEESAVTIDTTTLRKQKVLSYPRNRIHYYNRVVRENVYSVDGTTALTTNGNDDATCYFVLEYNEDKGLICIVPMIANGKLTGKRIGRPRYQCQMDHKFMVVEADKYYIVPSAMIMKTPIVAQEAWDIATRSDTEFVTR